MCARTATGDLHVHLWLSEAHSASPAKLLAQTRSATQELSPQPSHAGAEPAMASALRSSLAQGSRALRLSPPLNGQQQRFAGQLPVKSNKHIEEWGAYRENLEHHFKFDNRAWTFIALFGVGFPLFIYNMTVAEFNKTDALYKRPKREFM